MNAHIYNTETPQVVCDVGHGWRGADLDWHETTLYRTKKGAVFIAGKGGPHSIWAQRVGSTSSRGSGLRIVDTQEARSLMESADPEHVYHAAGLPLLEE